MDLLKNGRLALIQVELLAGEIKLRNQIQQSRNIQRLRVRQRTYLANDFIADDFLYCQSKQEADERRDDLHGYGIYLTDVGEDALPLQSETLTDECSHWSGPTIHGNCCVAEPGRRTLARLFAQVIEFYHNYSRGHY